MITRIELTNFMSHAHTVIEPAAGLTVLVGPNNCGKSAVVAALQILCHNENSTYVLRHGARECSVKVATDDGHIVEWRRKKSPSYVIDGQLFDRLGGGGYHDALREALRLPKVGAEDGADFDVHLAAQKSPIFLLASSEANAAKFYASSSDAIRLVEMQKLHKEKLADAKRKKNLLEAESIQLNKELELLEPVVDLDQRLEAAEQAYEELTQFAAWLKQAKEDEVALQTQLEVVARHAADAQSLAPLKPPPTLASVSFLADSIDAIVEAESGREDAASRVEALAKLASPPELHDVVSLARLRERLNTLMQEVDLGAACHRVLAPLTNPPQLANIDSLAALTKQLHAAEHKLTGTQRRSNALSVVAEPPKLEDEVGLTSLLTAIAEATAEIATCNRRVAILAAATSVPAAIDVAPLGELLRRLEEAAANARHDESRLKQAADDLAAAETALREQATGSICQTCGSPLDPDRVVARAAGGLGGHDHGI